MLKTILKTLRTLMYRSSRFSFFLMYLLSLPVLLEAPFILKLWLKTVPDNTVVFLRIIICTTLIYTIANPILAANNATGDVRNYYIVCGSLMISILPISYIILRLGCPAYSVFIVHFCIEAITQIARLFMVRNRLHLSIRKYLQKVYIPIAWVVLLSCILPIWLHLIITAEISRFITVGISSFLSVCTVSLFIGFTSHERSFILKRISYFIEKI